MVTRIGLDLGYANITLSDAACNVYREPSVALVQKESRSDVSRIVAIGNEALSPDPSIPYSNNAMLVRPFKNGILFDSQLTGEIINNAIDEYLNENSISDGNITIHYDESENMIYVQDTGRGIPFEEIVNSCTILHSGTKMLREHASTSGENG